MTHTHSCGASWTGDRRAHCGGCHRTFSGTATFDRHHSPTQLCLDPEKVGLVPVEEPWGVMWSVPRDENAPKWWEGLKK